MILKLLLALSFTSKGALLEQTVCEPCHCCKNNVCPNDLSTNCSNGCLDGYSGRTCQNGCKDSCETCYQYNENYCYSCKAGYYNGRISDQYIGDCSLTCPDTCFSCTSDTYCSSCKNGFYNGYYNYNKWYNDCTLTCYSGCKACTSYDKCTECTDGYFGQFFTKPDCSDECYSRCKTCTSYNVCNECKIGFFGPTCQYNCSIGCRDNVCNKENGYCDCVSTFWGEACENTCSGGCASLSCSKDTGKCSDGCQIGFDGDRCDACANGFYYINANCTQCPPNCRSCVSDKMCNECDNGLFGQTCKESCPANCLNSICNIQTGLCLGCSASCNATEGQLPCQIENGVCLNGCVSLNIYGAYCEKNCSINCKENVCSWLTGDCVKGCQNNHWGKQCEHVCNDNCKPIEGATSCNESNGHCLAGCKDGYHSVQCDKTCSINCLNSSCDISGRCIHGCSDNFVGDSCLQVKYRSSEKSSGDTATIGGSVGGALTLTIIVIVAAIVLFKRRRRTEQNIEGNHGNNTVVYSNMEIGLHNRDTETPAAEGTSAAYEILARTDESADYSALSCDTNQSAAFLDVGSRLSEKVAAEKVQTIYEKPIKEEDTREYEALKYDTSQTSDEYLYGNKDKIQNQSLTLGKGTARRDSADNMTNTGACSFDEKKTGDRGKEHTKNINTDYINTSLGGVSKVKKYP